ncbi:MAG: hypothetical protein ACE5EL_03785, partial [Anaerolineae bacterium]
MPAKLLAFGAIVPAAMVAMTAMQGAPSTTAAAKASQAAALEFEAQLGGGSFDVELDADAAYLSVGPSVHILGISTLGRPATLGMVGPWGDVVRSVAVLDGVMYTAVGAGGLAITDVSNPQVPRPLAQLALNGAATAVEVSSGRGFVALDGAGLTLVDVGDPGAPAVVSRLDEPSLGGNLAVTPDGATVYALAGARADPTAGGVVAIDVTDPVTPTVMARFGPGATDLALDGDRLLLATDQGMAAYDVADAAAPVEAGQWEGTAALAVVADAGRAFVASARGGIDVIDLATMSAADRRLDTEGWAAALATSGGRLAGAINRGPIDGDPYAVGGGLAVWDVARSGNPAIRTTYASPSGQAHGVAEAGRVVLMVEGGEGTASPGRAWSIEAVDAGAPFPDGSATTPGRPYDVAAAAPYGFVTAADGFLVVDSTEPGVLRAALRAPDIDLGDSGLATDGWLLYAVSAAGLEIVQVSNPLRPREKPLAAVPDLGPMSAVALAPGRAYTGGEGGLAVLDVRVPSWPRTLARMPGLGPALDVAATGTTAWVANRLDGLREADASVVARIGEVAAIEGPGLLAVAAAAGHVVTLDENGTVALIDTSEAAPRVVAIAAAPECARDAAGVPLRLRKADLAVRGQTVYVARPDRGLLTYRATGVDITPPTPTPSPPPPGHRVFLPIVARRAAIGNHPLRFREVARYSPLNTQSYGLALRGQVAYVGQQGGGRSWLETVDISHLPAAIEIGRVEHLAATPLRLAFAGDMLLAVAGAGGLMVFDVSDSAMPRLVGNVTTTRFFSDVIVRGNRAYVLETRNRTEGPTDVIVFDLTAAETPRRLGSATVAETDPVTHLSATGSWLFASIPALGLRTIDITNPANPAVAGDYPLPGTQATLAKGERLLAVNHGGGTTPGGLWLLAGAEAGSLT